NNQYDESAERIEAELKSVDDRIKQYSQVVKVAKYQEGLAKDEDAGSASSSEFDSLESELLELKIRLSSVTRELNEVNSVISMSKGFIDYVKRKKIYIKLDKSQDDLMLMDDDEEPEEDAAKGIICVNESNLFYYNDQLLVDEARQSVLKAEMDELRRNIARIEARRAELLSAGGSSAVDRQIRRIFNQMPVSLDEAQKKLDDLKAEKKKLRDSLSAEIAQGSDWLDEIKKWYKIYSEKLEIPKTSELDIMTRRTGGSSGTILYKLVVASKLACAKALSEKLGYPVPIFCDSPRGREVTDDKVKTVMELLRDEFAEHQIFIATIGEYGEIFPDANEITMNRTMFDLRE
ncbi:MAG: hypothetical protein LUD72_07330, partial [Bacteroidales bacterium]|nr:hypothetical protein [Bacteroidales bacterium]